MRYLFRLIIISALAIGLALLAGQDANTWSFRFGSQIIEINRNLALLLAAVLFGLLYFILWVFGSIRALPGRVSRYRRERARMLSDESLRDAVKFYFEGRYVQAEKAARNCLRGTPDNRGVACLIGARAAQALSQAARRDEWLGNLAREAGYEQALMLTSADLAVERHDFDEALDAIGRLNASGRRHVHAMRLALKANQQARRWSEVLRLVRQLEKHNALELVVASRMRAAAYAALFERAPDVQSVQQIWKMMNADERREPLIVSHAARACIAVEAADMARTILEQALSHTWDSQLLFPYRRAAADAGSAALVAQIERCERWLASISDDGELCLTLGYLCQKQRLWGKAQRYLERALSHAPRPQLRRQVHLALAQLHTSLEQPQQAAEHYRLSAELGLVDAG